LVKSNLISLLSDCKHKIATSFQTNIANHTKINTILRHSFARHQPPCRAKQAIPSIPFLYPITHVRTQCSSVIVARALGYQVASTRVALVNKVTVVNINTNNNQPSARAIAILHPPDKVN
jgi:hypothetical protein